MVLHLSDFGPNCSEIRDLPSSNIDQDKTGHISRKKHSRLRTEENDDQTNTELVRKTKVKKSYTETGDDSSSSDHSCFVALVTASNLQKDALYLPQDLTISVGLKRSCSEIVVTDERERSWTLDLRFNKSSDTFYISRGWRSFCDENDKKAGGIFVFKLVVNEETPMLSFCSTDSINDERKGDTNNKGNCMELERKRKRLRSRDSTSSRQNRFVTLTLPDGRSKRKRLYLPKSFRREIGIHKPMMITMLGKYGRKSLVNLRWDTVEGMCFGRGLKDFAKANGLRSGESFTLEAILENGTPMLRLFSRQSTNDRIQQGECSKDGKKESINDGTNAHTNNKGNCMELFRCRDSSSPSLDRKQQGDCSKDSKRESISPEPSSRFLKPMLSFCSTDSTNDGTKGDTNNQGKCMELFRCRDSSSPSENRFVTLTLSEDNLRRGRRYLPLSFTRENGLDKPGIITLVGKDGTRWDASLRRENNGIMCLGKGWCDFAIANGLKCGESFCLESNWENGTPTLTLFSTQSTDDRKQQGECSKESEKESISTEPSSGKGTREAKNNRDVKRDSIPACLNRFVTLTLTHDNLITGRKYLPLSFTRENGLENLAMITLVGKDGTQWVARLRRENTGIMGFGKGWKRFVKENGLKSGESFTLELIWENGTPTLSLLSTQSTDDRKQQGGCSKDSQKESISTEPSSGNKTKKVTNNREERRDSSSAIQSRFVTLTLTPEDVRDCKLILPSQFMKANGINKLGKITFLGKNSLKWFAYLLSKDGIVALGCGWKDFCEANGVKTGESFTLECVYIQDTAYVFKFCSNAVE